MSSTSSTNEVNTAYGVSTANTQVSTASTQVSTANLSDDTVYAFLASQPNRSHLVHEDLEQIHEDDLEEMDLKWQLALLSMRTRKFFQKTGRKITINGSDTVDMQVKEKCFNYHIVFTGAFRIEFNKSEFNLATYKRGLASVEEQLVFYKKNERQSHGVSLVEELVSNDKLEKKTVFPTITKINFVRPQQQEKPLGISLSMLNVQANCNYHKRKGRVISQKEDQGYVDSGGCPRFTWVFFLASKDETNGILKSFITQIENLVDKKVLIIRCDNGTEFKNRVMSEFYAKKGIKREFIVARTPQQNGVAERRNRTLIEAARTMRQDLAKLHFDASMEDGSPFVSSLTGCLAMLTNLLMMLEKKEEPKKIIQALKDLSRIEAMQEELLQFKLQQVWTLVDLLYGKRAIGTKWVYRNKKDEERIEALEVYVCQPPEFEDPEFPDKVYKVEKALYGLHQAPRACQDKYMDEILKKFGFSTVKTASIPIETSKPLIKDAKAEDVDVHLYRSMIGSLMYLTASRPNIMFAVCACTRFQVTPKVSHLHDVKRIFRYLKGQPKLGLWYPKDSPFDLEAYTDSDYTGASLDRKSTTGGCQFLGRRLILWQCKKQTIVANSTTEAEYVAAASCCGQGRLIVINSSRVMHKCAGNGMENQLMVINSTFSTVGPYLNTGLLLSEHFDNGEQKLLHRLMQEEGEVQDIPLNPKTTFYYSNLFMKNNPNLYPYPPKDSIHRASIKPGHYVTSRLVSFNNVADETVYEDWDDRVERAATTAASLDAE
ncbi:retrovirus-related pol polyprotein from transposon TNT 1-94 [Tanacetum coccineum]